MAVIDGYAGEADGPTVTQYRVLLDRIGGQCSEGRERIADQAVAVRNILRDEIGAEESTLDQLRAFREVTAQLQGNPECVGAFAAYAQVRVAQGP